MSWNISAPARRRYTGPSTGRDTPGGTASARRVRSARRSAATSTYSVAWDPGKILWYVNNDLYHAVTPADLNGKPWVFDHEFFLLINIAVGGTASVPPDESVTFPQAMLIDYIRLYEPAAQHA